MLRYLFAKDIIEELTHQQKSLLCKNRKGMINLHADGNEGKIFYSLLQSLVNRENGESNKDLSLENLNQNLEKLKKRFSLDKNSNYLHTIWFVEEKEAAIKLLLHQDKLKELFKIDPREYRKLLCGLFSNAQSKMQEHSYDSEEGRLLTIKFIGLLNIFCGEDRDSAREFFFTLVRKADKICPISRKYAAALAWLEKAMNSFKYF